MGPKDAPPMVFVHPMPMDSASWLFQMAHFSTWYRCIAIDLPGLGRSPSAISGLTMEGIAQACWDAVDRVTSLPGAILVGCSVGSRVVQWMYHLRPDTTEALVVSGAGWRSTNSFAHRRISDYRQHGIDFRYEHSLAGLSSDFAQSQLGHWLATLMTQRNDTADLDTIITLFEAVSAVEPDWVQKALSAPVLIISGSQDSAHEAAFALRDLLPDAEVVTVEGAGHACQFERPWAFDREMIRFLIAHGQSRLGHAPL